MNANNTLLLVDGNGLLYRAFHAFPPGLSTPAGEPINAVYGFTRILLTTLKTLKPESVAVCFDLKGPTFRHKEYAAYKGTRQKMPEELAGQIERMYEVVRTLEFPIYTAEGFEADDCIGTLARQAEAAGKKVVILTGDQDIIQLVTDKVFVLAPTTKGTVMYTPESVEAKYGFRPDQMVDYKGLRGDPSDNLPGIPGIGEVTATHLLKEFGGIDNLYLAVEAGKTDGLKPAILAKLQGHKESALLSRRLATISTDAPVTYDPEGCLLQLGDAPKLVALFKELGFKSLMGDLPHSHRLNAAAADVFGAEEAPAAEEQPDNDAPPSDPVPDNLSLQVDRQLEPVLRSMEELGVKVDCDYLATLEKEFAAELDSLRAELGELAGEEFSPDSPQQIAHILYEVLGAPTDGIRKGKTGYTTDAATLADLADSYPIATLILRYREIGKLQSTYVRPLQGMTDEKSRVHTSYAPDTSTGRLSSRNPNLQNIPIRSELGRRIRKAFVADAGKVLVSADYSQIELRIAAHLSGDPAMREVFASGRDVHAETAARMGVERHTAKMINFSILYGKGAFGFARDLGITVAQAKEYIDNYFKTYSRLREYLDKILADARTQGYLETLHGRRLAFPDILSKNFNLRSAAEREALNYPIQGSQADILKSAMVSLFAALKETKSPARMILTVHDELVLEVPMDKATEAARLLCQEMLAAAKLDVPVQVSAKVGVNWAEMREIPAGDI